MYVCIYTEALPVAILWECEALAPSSHASLDNFPVCLLIHLSVFVSHLSVHLLSAIFMGYSMYCMLKSN